MIPDLYERKLGFWEMFQSSWDILRRNIRNILIIVLGMSVLFKILDYSFFRLISGFDGDPYLTGKLKNIVSSFFGYVPFIAVILITQRSLAMDNVFYSHVFKGIKKYFWVGFWVQMMSQIIGLLTWIPYVLRESTETYSSTVAFFGLFIPIVSLVLMVYFVFAFQALILREKKPVASFLCSFRVVRGRWWRVAGVMISLGLLVMTPLYLLIGFIIKISALIDMQSGMYFAAPIFSLAGAFMNIFASVLFLNINREGSKSEIDELRHPVDPVNPV